MSTTEMLNKTFVELYSMKDPYVFPSALSKHIEVGNTNPIMLLDEIYKIGYADKEKNTQQSGGSQSVYNYWLNPSGYNFIDDLPKEFVERPYSYYIKFIQESNDKKQERDKLEDKLKKITLKNIDFNKYLSIGSLIVAIIAILTPIYINHVNEGKTTKTETTIPQLNKLQQGMENEHKALQNILDSLRKK